MQAASELPKATFGYDANRSCWHSRPSRTLQQRLIQKGDARPLPFVIETLIVAAAAALQAGTGMGMALLAAPLLLLVDRSLVPGPMLCATMVLSIAVVWRETLSDRSEPARRRLPGPGRRLCHLARSRLQC